MTVLSISKTAALSARMNSTFMRIKKMKITVKVGNIELTYQEDNYKTDVDFDTRMIRTLCKKAEELLKKQQEVNYA